MSNLSTAFWKNIEFGLTNDSSSVSLRTLVNPTERESPKIQITRKKSRRRRNFSPLAEVSSLMIKLLSFSRDSQSRFLSSLTSPKKNKKRRIPIAYNHLKTIKLHETIEVFGTYAQIRTYPAFVVLQSSHTLHIYLW